MDDDEYMYKKDLRALRRRAVLGIKRYERYMVHDRETWSEHPALLEEQTERNERWLAYYRNQLVIIDLALEHDGRLPRRSEVTQEPIR